MNNLLSTEVVWFLIGLVLLLAELVLPGLVILFFGIGAWITALAVLLFHPGLNVQLAIFLLSSLITLSTLRRAIYKRYTQRKAGSTADLEEEYIGKKVVAIEDFDVNGKGRVSFRGTTWQAEAEGPVVKGQELIIRSFDSIRLFVSPAGK